MLVSPNPFPVTTTRPLFFRVVTSAMIGFPTTMVTACGGILMIFALSSMTEIVFSAHDGATRAAMISKA